LSLGFRERMGQRLEGKCHLLGGVFVAFTEVLEERERQRGDSLGQGGEGQELKGGGTCIPERRVLYGVIGFEPGTVIDNGHDFRKSGVVKVRQGALSGFRSGTERTEV
jgi:hypothetical protein